jgi:hypothetical protein
MPYGAVAAIPFEQVPGADRIAGSFLIDAQGGGRIVIAQNLVGPGLGRFSDESEFGKAPANGSLVEDSVVRCGTDRNPLSKAYRRAPK